MRVFWEPMAKRSTIKIAGFICVLIAITLTAFWAFDKRDEPSEISELDAAMQPVIAHLEKRGLNIQEKKLYKSMRSCRKNVDKEVAIASDQGTPVLNLGRFINNKEIYGFFLTTHEKEGVGLYCIPWQKKAAFIKGDLRVN